MTRTVLKIRKTDGSVVGSFAGCRDAALSQGITHDQMQSYVYRRAQPRFGDFIYLFKEDYNGEYRYKKYRGPILATNIVTGETHWFSSVNSTSKCLNYSPKWIGEAISKHLIVGKEWIIERQGSTKEYEERWVIHHDL